MPAQQAPSQGSPVRLAVPGEWTVSKGLPQGTVAVTPKSTLGTLCVRQREGHTGQEARKPRAVAESSISDKAPWQTPDRRWERRPVRPPSPAQNTLLMFTSRPRPPRSQEPCMIHSSSRSPTPHIHQGVLGVLTCGGGCLSPVILTLCFSHLPGPPVHPHATDLQRAPGPHMDTVRTALGHKGSLEPHALNLTSGALLVPSGFPRARRRTSSAPHK